jgi:hypothetical protein
MSEYNIKYKNNGKNETIIVKIQLSQLYYTFIVGTLSYCLSRVFNRYLTLITL